MKESSETEQRHDGCYFVEEEECGYGGDGGGDEWGDVVVEAGGEAGYEAGEAGGGGGFGRGGEGAMVRREGLEACVGMRM